MRVRRVTNGLRQFGHGQLDFWINMPDGVAQVVGSRLGLWRGQWFLNVDAGMPWATKVLGYYTGSTRDIALQAEILGTPGLTPTNAISKYSSVFNSTSRVWTVSAELNTIYGKVTFVGVY